MLEKFFSYLSKNQVVLTFFLIISGWFIYETRGIWASFFLSYILMAALLPFVHTLRKWKFPRIVSVLIPFFTVLLIIILLIVPLVPFSIAQTQALFEGLPKYINQLIRAMGLHFNSSDLQNYFTSEIGNLGQNAVSVTSQVFGKIFTLFSVLILSFYLLFYHDKFQEWVRDFFPKRHREKVAATFNQVDEKLGAWMRGQLVLSLFIGTISWVVLSLLNVPYALPLSLLAGMLEVLPTIGPILSAVPATIIALTISPTLAIGVMIAYFCIQLFENHVLVPNVMQRAVGLNPILVILGITIGGSIMGIAGALLSIPFISFIIVIFNNIHRTDEDA
jgi:predicted PurR-regulated permease PerM